MSSEEARRLARIAAVSEDLDRTLDRLFASVGELKKLAAGKETPDGHERVPGPCRGAESDREDG
jgi:hypothetical protein